jgi:hypothetical protein
MIIKFAYKIKFWQFSIIFWHFNQIFVINANLFSEKRAKNSCLRILTHNWRPTNLNIKYLLFHSRFEWVLWITIQCLDAQGPWSVLFVLQLYLDKRVNIAIMCQEVEEKTLIRPLSKPIVRIGYAMCNQWTAKHRDECRERAQIVRPS